MSKVKQTKKNIDAMLSDESSDVVEAPKKVNKKVKNTKPDSDESSNESVEMLKKKRKASKEAPIKKGKGKVSKPVDSDDESSEPQTKKKTVKATKKSKQVESTSSSEDEDVKKSNTKTKKPVKKAKEESDESSSEEVVAKKSTSKKYQEEESDDESEVQTKKSKAKKEEDSDEEDNAEIEVVKTNGVEQEDGETHSELFVRNLSYNSNEDSLYEVFSQYGTVTNIKVLYDKMTGRSKGIGFIAFEKRSDAKKAMESIGDVDGRTIGMAWSNEKKENNNNGYNQGGQGGRPQNNDRQYGNNNRGGPGSFKKVDFQGEVHTIFIGNLGFKTSEQTVANFFQSCGNVVDVRIAKGEDGRSKGFCHLDFDSSSAVETAKAKTGENLDGREIRVDGSNPRNSNRGGFGGGRGGGFGGQNRGPPKQTHPKMGASGKKVTFD